MNLPGAIIFINKDINDGIRSLLITQLFINDVMDGNTFDGYVSMDPGYVNRIHGSNLRVLVIRESFRDFTNRELADVVIFIKNGMASVEENKLGPPRPQFPLQNLTIYQLLGFY